jgi:hypothetical protein
LEYEFLYKESKMSCEGGSVVPESPGLSLGGGAEEVLQGVEGLTGATEYTVCVRVTGTGGTTTSPPVTFKTAITPETPVTGEATGVTATSAVLGGTLNPGAVGDPGSWEVRYNTGEGECSGGRVAPEPAGTATGAKEEAVSTPVTGLAPATTYTFCLLARNTVGEETLGGPVVFTTTPAPPVVVSESVSSVEASAVTVEGEITPEGAPTTYLVQYGTSEAYSQSTPVSTSVGSDDSPHHIATHITGLTANTTYHYRIVATNRAAPSGVPGADKTFLTQEASGETPDTCPNAERRAEQPSGRTLPDCRAYEMVSPTETNGQDATDATIVTGPRAATSGEAIAYASRGAFGAPAGANLESELISRREPNGWATQDITPLFNPQQLETVSAYQSLLFTPQLTEGLAGTSASLTKEAPTPAADKYDVYRVGFASGEYQYVGETGFPMGVSSDLSRVVLGEEGNVSEWQAGGNTVPVSVSNDGEPLNASVGNEARSSLLNVRDEKDVWHAVSVDGSRAYFTSPAFSTKPGIRQLYLRLNAGRPESPLGAPEANGTGTLTEGSSTVTSLATATGYIDSNEVPSGASELSVAMIVGQFRVGQPLSGPAFASGTTVTSVSAGGIGLSKPTVASLPAEAQVSSEGPAPFVTGEKVSGNGVAQGTTITGIALGSLMLSKPAVSSGLGVELRAGGECVVAGDACTVDVSASQRALENPAGSQSARYWDASTDGSKVFFTSTAELTEDADTGTSGNAPNLYECELVVEEAGIPVPPKCDLKDLTVPSKADLAEDPEGAAVRGVVQISEDGSYVYFVAKGALAPGATTQTCTGAGPGEGCNLYVSHDGETRLVATLPANDQFDWSVEEPIAAGPGVTTGVVSPGGRYLAFMSERSLTGYDNRQAQAGDCEGKEILETGQLGGEDCREVFLYDAVTGGLACASCNPSGARPVGFASFRTQPGVGHVGYRPRNLLEDGTLFFNSSDALAPNATGGLANVYEYEGGHVFAVSDVAGAHESFFMDASGREEAGGEGGNVFFATSNDLVPQDTGQNIVVYDARVDGGLQPSAAPVWCASTEACKPGQEGQPGIFGPSGSATFLGPRNLTPKPKPKPETRAQKLAKALNACRRKRVRRKRAACQRAARARYGPVKARKGARKSGYAGGERRAGR